MMRPDLLETERRRLAQRLEEGLIVQITLLLAQATVYEQTATAESRQGFAVLAALSRQLWQQAHDLTASLNPQQLEALGLAPALETLASQQQRSTGLTVHLQIVPNRLSPSLELALFRLSQDAIASAHHRRASWVQVALAATPNAVLLRIRDDGHPPTDAEALFEPATDTIEALGGTLRVGPGETGGMELAVECPPPLSDMLTVRERQVLDCLVQGLTNKQIAARLGVRPRTVKFHVDNLFSKLGVASRTEAAVYALRHLPKQPG